MTEAMSLEAFLASQSRGQKTGMAAWLRTLSCGVPTRVPDELVAHYQTHEAASSAIRRIARTTRGVGKVAVRHFGDETWVALLPPTDGAA